MWGFVTLVILQGKQIFSLLVDWTSLVAVVLLVIVYLALRYLLVVSLLL